MPTAATSSPPAPRAHLPLLVAALTGLAAAQRFVHDDAFIAFRYARHLAQGHGLVWNVGERVEGYTDFLWTLLMAAAMRLGLEPVATSIVLGLAAFAAALAATYSLGRRCDLSHGAGLLMVALLGTNHTFYRFATGGLESSLQCALLAWATVAVLDALDAGLHARRALGLSALLTLAVLTRPDSVVIAGVLGAAALLAAATRRDRHAGAGALALIAPMALVLGAWTAWRVRYYGDLLPNTFWAKVGPGETLLQGAGYAASFALFYFAPLVLLAPFVRWGALARAVDRRVALLAAVVATWTAAVVWEGGDFMEYRFFVAVLPAIVVLAGWAVIRHGRGPLVTAAFAVLMLGASFAQSRRATLPLGIETVRQMSGHIEYLSQDWDGVGRALHRLFRAEDGVSIATTAAGAVPYYAELPAVDMHGLTDRWIARHGMAYSRRSGHRRLATIADLRRRSVTLVLGHPQQDEVADRDRHVFRLADLQRFRVYADRLDELPAGVRVIELPTSATYDVPALYLTPNAAVERGIREQGWRTYPVLPDSVSPARAR